jgi:hypothetical protein
MSGARSRLRFVPVAGLAVGCAALLVNLQVDEPDWRYKTGKKHPTLCPSDPAQPTLPVPTTPGDHRSWRNFKAQLRRCRRLLVETADARY